MMRSHLEFRSSELLESVPSEGKPAGEAVARLLTERLPAYGFQIASVISEDWGWRIQLVHEAFPLWIGCGYYPEYPDGHLCFIEPSKPFVRRWLKRIPTSEAVERLATALEQVMRESGKASGLRWWTDAEVANG